MRKLMITAVVAMALGALVGGTAAPTLAWGHDEGPKHGKPKPEKDKLKLASALAVALAESGIAATWDADTLSDYAIHVAIHVVDADYTADP